MNCPICDHHTICIDTRPTYIGPHSHPIQRRRHQCKSCRKRFTTIELILRHDASVTIANEPVLIGEIVRAAEKLAEQ